MDSVGLISTIYTVFISILLGIVLLLFLWRCKIYFYPKNSRISLRVVENQLYIKILKGLCLFTMLLILITTPILLYIGSAFKPFIHPWLNHAFTGSVILTALLEMRLSFSASASLLERRGRKVIFTLITILIFSFSAWFAVNVPDIFTFPPKNESYIVDLPVRGTWSAGHAGGSEMVNYHNAHRSQKFAIDIVKVNEQGHFYKNRGHDLSDIHSFGERIYAPASGIVVGVVDSLPNHGISLAPSDPDNPAGNHAVIRFDDERYIFLAHLQAGSLAIQQGDTVEAGDFIGTVGNSGNTSWPHLHMHIQDRPELDYENAKGYPFRFRQLERKRWLSRQTVQNGFLIRNDQFREVQKN